MGETIQKPEWMTEFGRRGYVNLYSQFQNVDNDTWAFLYNAPHDLVLLAGVDVDWDVKTLPGKRIHAFNRGSVIDQITTAGALFELVMHLEERMWLTACLREAADLRERVQARRKG